MTEPIRIRVYNVGFGDCILLRLPTPTGRVAKILIDCGSLSFGETGQNNQSVVERIIGDVSDEGAPHIDVVVASASSQRPHLRLRPSTVAPGGRGPGVAAVDREPQRSRSETSVRGPDGSGPLDPEDREGPAQQRHRARGARAHPGYGDQRPEQRRFHQDPSWWILLLPGPQVADASSRCPAPPGTRWSPRPCSRAFEGSGCDQEPRPAQGKELFLDDWRHRPR